MKMIFQTKIKNEFPNIFSGKDEEGFGNGFNNS
jgi:hypothetical protein